MTLIELLTALSITVLLLAVSIPIFMNQAKKGNIEASAGVAEQFIGRARNLAFNPDEEFPVEYDVALANSPNTIVASIQRIYHPLTDPTGDTITENVDQISIDGATISSVAPVTIRFKALTGEMIDYTNLPMTMQAINNNFTKKISINQLGRIEVGN